MSINEARPSVSTIPMLKPISNPDLWEYNPEELVRFTPLRRFSSNVVVQTHPLCGLISKVDIHQWSTQIKHGVTTARGCSQGNTPLCLDTLNGITRMNNNVCVAVFAIQLKRNIILGFDSRRSDQYRCHGLFRSFGMV